MKSNVFKMMIIAVLVSTFMFTGCSEKNESNYTIGAILPLTGGASFIGTSIKNGISLAVEMSSKDTHVYYEDSKGNPKDALTIYQSLKLKYNTKNFIVALTSITNALIPQSQNDDEILFATCVSAPDITEKSTNLFRLFVNAEADAIPMANYSFNSLQISKYCVLYVNDDFGLNYKDTFSNQVNQLGGNVVLLESFEKEENDFQNIVSKLKANEDEFDAIYLLGYENNMGILVSKLSEYGINKPILSIATINQPNVKEYIDRLENIPEIYFSNTLLNASTNESPEKSNFTEAYQQKYNESPNYFAAFAFDLTNILLDSIDKENPKSHIYSSKFDGVMGEISFTSTGDAEFEMVIEKYERGK